MASVNFEKIRGLIAQGQVDESLDLLINTVDKKSEHWDLPYLLKAQWLKLKKDIVIGLSDERDLTVQRNRILSAILHTIESIESERVENRRKNGFLFRIAFWLKNDRFFLWSLILFLLFTISTILQIFVFNDIIILQRAFFIGLGLSSTIFIYRTLYLYLSDKGLEPQIVDEKIILEIDNLKKQFSDFDIKQQ